MIYYKVVERINKEAIVDTATTNYSLTLSNSHEYKSLIDIVTNFSHKLQLPLDFFISLNNNLALLGNAYLDNFPKPTNGKYELVSLTTNANHANYFITISNLNSVISQLDNIGIQLFQEGFYLWEKIYEDARTSKFADKPRREKSFFLFDNVESCQYYIDNHKGGGQICLVEPLETKTLFKADMNLLDEIPNNFTYTQAFNHAEKYWDGQASNKPIVEYLFQGICKLTPL